MNNLVRLNRGKSLKPRRARSGQLIRLSAGTISSHWGSLMLSHMDCFGLTDTGHLRPSNQDHYLIADLNKSLGEAEDAIGRVEAELNRVREEKTMLEQALAAEWEAKKKLEQSLGSNSVTRMDWRLYQKG